MSSSDVLISICLPVRNGASTLPTVVESILAQDHASLELVIADNASTDGTGEFCRELAADDERIVYIRQPQNIGIVNNFQSAMQHSRGTFFRWVSDDDWLAPNCLSSCLQVFEADQRLILVTTEIDFTGDDGVTRTAQYHGDALASDDPIERLSEILRLLNDSYLLIDPIYGLMRRDVIAPLPRRNMLREDQIFATKIALAGPWGHVHDVLSRRGWRTGTRVDVARRLGVPAWTARAATTLQGLETLRWIDKAGLDRDQTRQARAAVYRWYLRRQQLTIVGRGRRVASLAPLRHRVES
jgi:glycosyltransferase involved in cell wall biosynthesis